MRTIKYYTALFLSVLSLTAPILGILIWYFNQNTIGIIAGVFVAVTGFCLNKPLTNLRVKLRQDIEYDEFGRSKTKGKYEYLSKSERDKIDLQKTLDMERVMSSSTIKKLTKEGSFDPKKDLNDMIGLQSVKTKVKEMVARMEFDQKYKKKNDKKDDSVSSRHMVFYGSPGTGKTTVARIITGFLYKNKYIKKNKCIEVDGNFLKAGEDTAIKTELIIREAFDGVLFIDEAYALMDDVYGKDAVATLIKQMEDNRGRFIVILAGYTNEMKNLLSSNPGFESRIKEYLDFPDYNNNEMCEIFKKMAKNEGFEVEKEAYLKYIMRLDNERQLNSFGNGRTARNILDESLDKHALNFVDGIIPSNKKFVICESDISEEIKRKNY